MLEFIDAQGLWIGATSALAAIVLGMLCIRDKRRYVALADETRSYRQTFETAPVGIAHLDAEGRWLRVNDRLLEITGYSRHDLERLTYKDITYAADVERNVDANRSLLEGTSKAYTLEKRYVRRDGSLLWARITVTLIRDAQGEPDFFVAVAEDIDDYKRSEAALIESEARFRAFWENSPFNQSLKDTQGGVLAVNDTYQRTYGVDVPTVAGKTLADAHGESWAGEVDEFDASVLEAGVARTADFKVLHRDGTTHTMRITKFPVYDARGEPTGVGGISYDITDQVRAARALRESESRFRTTFDQAAVGIAHVSLDGRWLRINRRYADMLGYTEAELKQLRFADITYPGDADRDMSYRNALVSGRITTYTREKRYIRKDGTPICTALTASKSPALGATEPYLIIVIQDITERKRAEELLAARVEQQSAAAEISRIALTSGDEAEFLDRAIAIVTETLGVDVGLISMIGDEPSALTFVAASEEGKKYLGMSVAPQTAESENWYDLITSRPVIYDNRDPDAPAIKSPVTDEIGTVSAATVVVAGENGPMGVMSVHCQAHRQFTMDDIAFMQAAANIVSATIIRNRIQRALIERERTLEAVLDNAADGIVAMDEGGKIQVFNHAAEQIFGTDAASVIGTDFETLLPKSYGAAQETDDDRGDAPPVSLREMKGLRADGSTVPIDMAMTTVSTPTGATMHIAIVRDISLQKTMQTQLIQASKLATVGEMTAGIAHELNQPLNIMRMAADNVLIRMESGGADLDYAARNLEMISEQAARMGKIILHMRVFSRQESVDFAPFDPVQSVRAACELMRSQLELDDIGLELDLPKACRSVVGQSSQLEQVMINIITNARDAIRDRRENGAPGLPADSIRIAVEDELDRSDLRIRVRDTGGGISDAVMQRVFDPFFTTKEVGVGTGLGLSVSYGIVTSMGGSITASNVDDGCEFTVELPVGPERRPDAGSVRTRARAHR